MTTFVVVLWMLGAGMAPATYKETVVGSYDDCLRAKKRAVAAWQARNWKIAEQACLPKKDVTL